MKPKKGFEPLSSGWKPEAQPLDQPRNVVYPLRLELRSAANRAAVLATGRQVQNWCSGRGSNPSFLVCRTRALAARRPERHGARARNRTSISTFGG